MPDGSYKVTLTVQGGKVYADGNGVESPAPLHDLIDVGVFSGKKDEEKPLAVRKEWITGGRQSFEFTVKERPTRAGIDPYNKLIDRNGDDNTMDTTRRRCRSPPPSAPGTPRVAARSESGQRCSEWNRTAPCLPPPSR
jgi:ABC-2 type transport system permease protein